MGNRAQEHYDREERERIRALPWRERYNWPGIALLMAVILAAAAGFWLSRL